MLFYDFFVFVNFGLEVLVIGVVACLLCCVVGLAHLTQNQIKFGLDFLGKLLALVVLIGLESPVRWRRILVRGRDEWQC